MNTWKENLTYWVLAIIISLGFLYLYGKIVTPVINEMAGAYTEGRRGKND